MWGNLLKLAPDLGVPATIVLLVVFAALLGYAVALLKSILKEIRELKVQVREDRERNDREHARLFSAVEGLERDVSDLKADVAVLRDRSDRSGPES